MKRRCAHIATEILHPTVIHAPPCDASGTIPASPPCVRATTPIVPRASSEDGVPAIRDACHTRHTCSRSDAKPAGAQATTTADEDRHGTASGESY